MAVKAKPEGYHSATPYLTIRDAARAIDFYRQAFGATELMRMPGPGGKIMQTHKEDLSPEEIARRRDAQMGAH
jgi:uncharacterized glyoxalase superfamily protein PhnB